MEKNEIDSYVEAGRISQEVKKFAVKIIEPGMKLIDIAEAIDAKILEFGAKPAFPVNLSMNEIAAHFTPVKGDTVVAEGVLKVDVGVAINGYIADTALSIDLTPDKHFEKMLELNRTILEEVTKVVKPNMNVGDVGTRASEVLKEWNEKNETNFSIIKSLCGHNLGHNNIHAGLTISNYENSSPKKLDEMGFAIEPFVTTGIGDIHEGQTGGIYVIQNDGNTRDRDARKILDFIKEEYSTRPFCERWLDKEGFKKIKFTLSTLVKSGILYHYPMLVENSKSPVSQFENTFIISGDTVINTSKVE